MILILPGRVSLVLILILVLAVWRLGLLLGRGVPAGILPGLVGRVIPLRLNSGGVGLGRLLAVILPGLVLGGVLLGLIGWGILTALILRGVGLGRILAAILP